MMQMKNIYLFIMGLLFIGIWGCNDTWGEHYDTKPETVDQYLWDVIKANDDASKFAELMEQYELDSIFKEEYNDVYTLFIPSNNAIDGYTGELNKEVTAYHILKHFIQPNNIAGQRKIQTLLLKFAQFENTDQTYLYDNIPVSYTSPLYIDGRYFIIDEVATPKPSLYEYIAENIPALKLFIDEQDSIILDKELSKPLGFDDMGNTIYDSVITVLNLFEEEFFEVSEEFRLKTATLVFPTKGQYEAALTEVALNLTGSGYENHEDIAEEWQQEVLIPHLLNKGVFDNQRESSEFQRDTLVNILGENVIIDFRPEDLVECSNGYAYSYANFEVLDSLYLSPLRNEGEFLLKTIGKDRFTWQDEVTLSSGDEVFTPDADFVNTASNDSILNIKFPKGYDGEFTLEFNSIPMFPRKYLVVIRTHMDFGGIYDIYVNDELVKTWDYYNFARFRGIIPSVVPGVRYKNDGRYNKFDFWVENITEYGPAKIRIEYKGPGNVLNNGFVLDYIEFVTEEMMDNITVNP